jgi:glycosyltransferase involved in cell wall biosynthesis
VTDVNGPAHAAPVVSVVVATRNRPQLLRECLEAIGMQTFAPIEVIVVDDGSTAATREAYGEMYGALQGRLHFLLPNGCDVPGTGPSAARNRGIRAARGTYLAFCDDDDRWIRPDHLATAVDALQQTGADFFFCDVIATRDGRPSAHVWFPESRHLRAAPQLASVPGVFQLDIPTLLRGTDGRVVHPDCWVVRRTLIDSLEGFWERLWFGEDYELMMRVSDAANGLLFRAEPCVDYRLPVGDSVSLGAKRLDTILQEINAAERVRITCASSAIRRAARSRAAWGLRQIADDLRRKGHIKEAAAFAWEGWCGYPTLGALRQWALTAVRSLARS